MQLKLTHVQVDGIHKVLVLDTDRTKLQGKLLYIAENKDQSLALKDALDYTEVLYKTQNPETVWN